MSDVSRVAVIGCGAIATAQHLPAYQAAAGAGLVTLVGVCDVDAERAQSAAQQYGVPAFDCAEELLETVRPDVVSIATLPGSHRDLAVRSLDAGCHVLCEKPVALHAREAAEMVRASEKNDRLLSICFEYRYWEEARYLKDRIAEGELGHVHAVRTWGGSAYGMPHRAHRSRGSGGGGVLSHWTIHNLDLVLWLLGNPEPLTASTYCHQRVRAHPQAVGPSTEGIDPDNIDPDFEDFGYAFVRLDGGTILTVEADFLQPPSTRREGWAFLCDRGSASISPIRLWHDDGEAWRDRSPAPGTIQPCSYDMKPLINGFLEAVWEGGEAPVSGTEIVRIQCLMDALYESASLGREVEVAPPPSCRPSIGRARV